MVTKAYVVDRKVQMCLEIDFVVITSNLDSTGFDRLTVNLKGFDLEPAILTGAFTAH